MTSIKFKGQFSGLIRKCSVECHDAKDTRCTCVCGGKYHGIGHEQAIIKYTEEKTGQADLFRWLVE